ncbi:MAG: metal-dependent hydrolase [Acidobacteriota bacterium]
MATEIAWHGHSTFEVHSGGRVILVDPFFNGNPLAKATPDSVKADFILVTHGHGDHIGDTVEIAGRTGATVISNFEICNWVGSKGDLKVHPQHIGGGFQHPFGYTKLTIAHHGSALPDGSYGGNPCGFLISLEGKKVYFAGDTGLFLEMQLYGEEGIDLAFLPVGDNFTMGPDDALRAVKLLRPRTVVPIHYGTWPVIEQSAEAWKQRVEKETSTRCVILTPGGRISP